MFTVAVILDEADFSKVLITMEKKILDGLKTNQKCVLGLRLRLPPRPDRDTLYAEPRAAPEGESGIKRWETKLYMHRARSWFLCLEMSQL